MSLAALRQQRNELADKMKALVPINADTGQIDLNGKELSDEDLAKYQALGRQVQALDTLITGEESAEAVEASRTAIAAALAEKNGTSTDEARATIKDKREAWANAVYDSLAQGHKLPTRSTESQRELLNIEGDTDAKGGYTVPSEVVGEMLTELNNENVVRRLARVGTVESGIPFQVPIFDLYAYEQIGDAKPKAPDRAAADQTGGGTTTNTGPNVFKNSKIEFQVTEVPAVAITREFLQDTTVENFADELLDGMATMMGSWELGIMSAHTAPAGGSHVTVRGFLVDATKARDAKTADTFVLEDLLALYGSLRERYRQRGTFMLGRGVIADALQFTVGNVPAWTPGFPNGRGGVGSPSLVGVPYVENEVMGTKTSAPGTPFVAFGDFKAYRIYDVAGALALNTYTDSNFAANYTIGVQVFNRVGARLVTAQTGNRCPLQYLASK